MEQKIAAIIVAGGKGERMGGDIPKQYMLLAGKPIIVHALEKFEQAACITDIIVVCDPRYKGTIEDFAKEYGIKKLTTIADGGKTRQESSFNGVKACPDGTEFVMIHDAVRPFVDEKMIEELVKAVKESGAAGPVIDPADTIIVEKSGYIDAIPDRGELRNIQTPQAFRRESILEAHKKAIEDNIGSYTDDCGLAMAYGISVKTVKGNRSNLKITSKTDLLAAEALLKRLS